MQDHITALCNRLMKTDDPKQLRPVATELQSAIRERFDRVRENALGVAVVTQIVELHTTEFAAEHSSDDRN